MDFENERMFKSVFREFANNIENEVIERFDEFENKYTYKYQADVTKKGDIKTGGRYECDIKIVILVNTDHIKDIVLVNTDI